MIFRSSALCLRVFIPGTQDVAKTIELIGGTLIPIHFDRYPRLDGEVAADSSLRRCRAGSQCRGGNIEFLRRAIQQITPVRSQANGSVPDVALVSKFRIMIWRMITVEVPWADPLGWRKRVIEIDTANARRSGNRGLVLDHLSRVQSVNQYEDQVFSPFVNNPDANFILADVAKFPPSAVRTA